MATHIIIDGYNLIRQSKTLGLLDTQNMQLGREALVDLLAAYKKIKSHKITIVFDGAQTPLLSSPTNRVRGIWIEFSRIGESADAVIKRLAHREKEKALVVSSDREVVDSAVASGAVTISAEGFENKIAMAVNMENMGVDEDDPGGWKPSTKKKGPSRRLPKKKRRDKVKIGKL